MAKFGVYTAEERPTGAYSLVADDAPLPVSQLGGLAPRFAAVAAATAGNNTLVAAVPARKIRVLQMLLVAGAAGNVYFTSAAGGTVVFGGSTNTINLAANGGFVLPFSPAGWFETAAGQLLNMNASSTGPFSGGLVYVEV